MKRVLLDTNIYGLIVVDTERDDIHDSIHKNKDSLLIYGFSIIRKELRDVPKRIKQKGRKLRIDLLNTYDEFVKKNYSVNKKTSTLAEDYFELYRRLGGSITKNKILNVFLIVDCATLHNLDIVVSEDKHSLIIDNALQAYKIVNKNRKLKLHKFISYENFKNELKKSI